jgi:hypothetical protein
VRQTCISHLGAAAVQLAQLRQTIETRQIRILGIGPREAHDDDHPAGTDFDFAA